MNLLFWIKKKNSENNYAPYEEIDAKRTSKLGYFFLILMIIFGIWQGNQFLFAVQDSVDRPQKNSYCSRLLADYADITFYSYEYSYRDANTFSNCNLSQRETLAGLNNAFKEASPLQNQLDNLNYQINSLDGQIRRIQSSKKETLDEYQASLLEEMSDRNDAQLDPKEIGSGYVSQKETLAGLNKNLSSLRSEYSVTEQKIRKIASDYRNALITIDIEYKHDVMKYEFIQFLISLLLVAPLFYFVWNRYNQAKISRSEYTIIWGGATATFGFILAQILLVFIYEILPKEFLKSLLSFLAVFEFIWTILYFLGFILVPLFFGFLIYIIQKKLYNKQAVLMRTLKSGHCPGCSLRITPDMNHCPICSYQIKHKCKNCGQMTLTKGRFCSVCGVKQEEN